MFIQTDESPLNKKTEVTQDENSNANKINLNKALAAQLEGQRSHSQNSMAARKRNSRGLKTAASQRENLLVSGLLKQNGHVDSSDMMIPGRSSIIDRSHLNKSAAFGDRGSFERIGQNQCTNTIDIQDNATLIQAVVKAARRPTTSLTMKSKAAKRRLTYTSPDAAQSPKEFTQNRVEQQMKKLAEFKDEIIVTKDTKLLREPNLTSEQVALLAKDSKVYCQNMQAEFNPNRAPNSVLIKRKSIINKGVNGAVKIDPQRRLSIEMPKSHWVEVYDARSNKTGFVLRTCLKMKQEARKNVDFSKTQVNVKSRNQNNKTCRANILTTSDSLLTGVCVVQERIDTPSFLDTVFVPFQAQSVADVPFLSGPNTSAAVLFMLPYKSELTAIAERLDATEHWY